MFPTKTRLRNTRMFLCPRKCRCWIRVRLFFPSGFASKTNFLHLGSAGTEPVHLFRRLSLQKKKNQRNSKNISYTVVFTIKKHGRRDLDSSRSQLKCKSEGNIGCLQWKEVVWSIFWVFILAFICEGWWCLHRVTESKYILLYTHILDAPFFHKCTSSENPSRNISPQDNKNFCKMHSFIKTFHVANDSQDFSPLRVAILPCTQIIKRM